jgi:tRNA nucleotidyltransferase (CCA-adding enzyme)
MEADILAHSKWTIKRRLASLAHLKQTAQRIISSGECYSLKGLAINGRDLEKEGVKGRRIGELLRLALQKVIRGEWENEKEKLLTELKKNNW